MTERIGLPDGRHVGVHVLGAGTGRRTVVLCHPSNELAGVDPDPVITATRDVNLIGVDQPADLVDLTGTADVIADVVRERSTPPVGIVGWSDGGWVALAVAAQHADLVDRLVLVGTPRPYGDDPLRAWGIDLGDVEAKALVLAGSADPDGGPRHGTWYQRRLPSARYEQVPGADQHLITPMWSRVLSHLAPRTTR